MKFYPLFNSKITQNINPAKTNYCQLLHQISPPFLYYGKFKQLRFKFRERNIFWTIKSISPTININYRIKFIGFNIFHTNIQRKSIYSYNFALSNFYFQIRTQTHKLSYRLTHKYMVTYTITCGTSAYKYTYKSTKSLTDIHTHTSSLRINWSLGMFNWNNKKASIHLLIQYFRTIYL